MMAKRLLEICVPSFNRVDSAICTAKNILMQIDSHSARVTVLDNASDVDYLGRFQSDSFLKERIDSGLLRVLRNSCNIGMSANFMRAFETAESEWMWMLSDDDEILDTVIETLLSKLIEQDKEIGLVRFQSLLNDDVRILNSLEDFIDYNSLSKQFFYHSILISNSIYRLSDFQYLVHVGYRYANTYIPHFMMQLSYFSGGRSSVFYRGKLVNYVVPETGYSYSMVGGLGVGAPKHYVSDISPVYYKKLSSIFYPYNDYKVIVDLFYKCKGRVHPSIVYSLSKEYVSYARGSRSIFRLFMLRLFIVLVNSPVLFESIVEMVASRSDGLRVHIEEIKRRYQ